MTASVVLSRRRVTAGAVISPGSTSLKTDPAQWPTVTGPGTVTRTRAYDACVECVSGSEHECACMSSSQQRESDRTWQRRAQRTGEVSVDPLAAFKHTACANTHMPNCTACPVATKADLTRARVCCNTPACTNSTACLGAVKGTGRQHRNRTPGAQRG